VVLEFELRTLSLLNWYSTTQAIPPVLFCFSYFSGRVSSFCLDWPRTLILPSMPMELLVYWLRWVLTNFLPSWLWTVLFPIFTSSVAGISGTIHLTWLCACKAGTLQLEQHFQPILLWLFWRWGSLELFAPTSLELGSWPRLLLRWRWEPVFWKVPEHFILSEVLVS
jgi:hypothetical protein